MSFASALGLGSLTVSTNNTNNYSTNSPAPTSESKARAKYVCRATQLTPRFDRLFPGEPCFLDIEFQRYRVAGITKEFHRVGRIAIVNSKGDTVLDVYAIYNNEESVTKTKQPKRFGVIVPDLTFGNGGVAGHKVEAWVARIVKDRTVVVHGGRNDMTAFYIEKDIFATSTVEDTQNMYGQVKLASLAYDVLEEVIQEKFHSPVEDADVTRRVYQHRRPYDRVAELAKVNAERSAAANIQPSNNPPAHGNTANTQAHKSQPAKKNLSGSAKRRNKKKAAQATVTGSAAGQKGVQVTLTKHSRS